MCIHHHTLDCVMCSHVSLLSIVSHVSHLHHRNGSKHQNLTNRDLTESGSCLFHQYQAVESAQIVSIGDTISISLRFTNHSNMQEVQRVNKSPCESGGDCIGEDADDGSIIKDSMITGRGPSDHSVDSPTLSRTSSDTDEIIDHTAALLGFMEDSDEDDLREISGFSPAVSLDLELEPIGNDEQRNATFEKIFSGDELDDEPTHRSNKVKPTQLNFASSIGKKVTPSQDELQASDVHLKQKDAGAKEDVKARKSLVDDIPFFYFDSTLVAQAVEEYGQRKRTDIDNKRKQAALKAKALKDKASSAISLKAKKAVSVPHALWDRKVRKSRDELDGGEHEDQCDMKPASKAAMMKLKAKAALTEKAKKAKEKMSQPKSIKDRKNKTSQESDGKESLSIDAVYSKLHSGMKLPTIPTAPFGEYIAKTGITVVGDMNKLVKQASGSIPAISACASNVSSNNSQVIDEDGFIISPTSSIDLLSPTTSFDGVDAACSITSPRSIASPKSTSRCPLPPSDLASPRSVTSSKTYRGGELPPSGKKSTAAGQKKDPSKLTLKLSKTKPRSHRRTTTASF